MDEARIDHAGGCRFPGYAESPMGVNKRRWAAGERERPADHLQRLAYRRVDAAAAREARLAGGDGEGRQYPCDPGQVDLFPPPAGSAPGQRLLF